MLEDITDTSLIRAGLHLEIEMLDARTIHLDPTADLPRQFGDAALQLDGVIPTVIILDQAEAPWNVSNDGSNRMSILDAFVNWSTPAWRS
ncbi:hypothetical protein [Nocardia salmonicida]|uniref:hypothetical protein n=1 Tax=Nocardia salmonicida TaxID=53431 RepID=UPI002E2ABA63|nr:hypothetical protein [Nocardia salmonicida]